MKNNKGFILAATLVILSVVVIYASAAFFNAAADIRAAQVRVEKLQLEHIAKSAAIVIAETIINEKSEGDDWIDKFISNKTLMISQISFSDDSLFDVIIETYIEYIKYDSFFIVTATRNNITGSYTMEVTEKW